MRGESDSQSQLRQDLPERIPVNLQIIESRPFAIKLLFFISLTGLGWAATLSENLILVALGFLLTGLMYAHALELQHQCLHDTACRSKRLNQTLGFLVGLPMMVSYSHYRTRHLAHHKFLGTSRDQEFFQYDNTGNHSLWSLILQAVSLKRYGQVGKQLRNAVLGICCEDAINTSEASQIRFEYLLMLVFILASVSMMALMGRSTPMLVWWLPALLVSEPVHFLIELPEHYACDRTLRDPTKNSRTVGGSWFSFWLTNGNNYHVEHHLYPKIPIHRLPILHQLIRDKINHFSGSYPTFFRQVMMDIRIANKERIRSETDAFLS
jgi:fatty acid desaturase